MNNLDKLLTDFLNEKIDEHEKLVGEAQNILNERKKILNIYSILKEYQKQVNK